MVEDESRMAGLLKRALQEEGHAVDVAADGQEGLWLATENAYGAIVLDVMLPGLDGIGVCRRLREAGSWVPVLLLTARDGVGDRVRGLDAGADDYLVKPFSLLELAARLRALARRDDRSRPVILAEGDLRLDPAAKRAWRAGTELHLTPKEFSLLEFFLRHPGRVLTRSARPGGQAPVRACPLLALRLDAGTGHRARSARLSLAIRRGQRPSPSRCRRCRRDSSGGPPAAPSPSVTEPPPEEDRPMISVPPEASATRRAMLRPRPVDPPLD